MTAQQSLTVHFDPKMLGFYIEFSWGKKTLKLILYASHANIPGQIIIKISNLKYILII